MSHNELDFDNLIHKRGFRVTPQRQLILEAVCAGGGHNTPEEIYARVQSKSSAINQATDLPRLVHMLYAPLRADRHWGDPAF